MSFDANIGSMFNDFIHGCLKKADIKTLGRAEKREVEAFSFPLPSLIQYEGFLRISICARLSKNLRAKFIMLFLVLKIMRVEK